MNAASADWHDIGCHKSCQVEHSGILGLCALADTRPADMPTLTVLRIVTAPDGEQLIATEQLTFMALTDVIREALKEVKITIGPNSLRVLKANNELPLTEGEYQNMAISVAAVLTEGGLT